MKSLLTVTLTAKQVREACIEWAEARTGVVEPSTCVALGLDEGLTATVEFRRKRAAPRKPGTNGNGVASSGKLSDAEERFA